MAQRKGVRLVSRRAASVLVPFLFKNETFKGLTAAHLNAGVILVVTV